MLISNLWRAARNSGAASAVPQRPEWTSQRAFIVASAASAVGLGNIWRFPYMVGESGGGTFIVAYGICIVVIGLPLFILETAAGSILDRGPVGGFRRIAGRWGAWLGWFIVAMVIVVMSYYLVITGWTLGYFVDAVRSDVRPFDEFVSGFASVWYLMVVGALVFLVLRQGTGGVERLSKVLMPGLMLVVGALAIYGQSLAGAAEARAFYLSFDLDGFLRLRTWLMAAGQAFFSLGRRDRGSDYLRQLRSTQREYRSQFIRRGAGELGHLPYGGDVHFCGSSHLRHCAGYGQRAVICGDSLR